MLALKIATGAEGYDEVNQVFVESSYTIINLEHSLYSVALWESKWKKAFLTKTPQTVEETVDYIIKMVVDPLADLSVLSNLSNENVETVANYINEDMTAVVIHSGSAGSKSARGMTPYADIIYAQMFELGIPLECQHWHLNRLLTLIRVMAIRQDPDNKMTAKERNKSNAEINAQRRAKLKTKG